MLFVHGDIHIDNNLFTINEIICDYLRRNEDSKAFFDATLSVQLKTLVDNGLVERVQYEDIPPRVEYSLTDIGKKFHPVVEAMKAWGEEYIKTMK